MPEPILCVRDLCVSFPVRRGIIFQHTTGHVRAVDGVSFDLQPGQSLGLVGESGCGKSTCARGIVQLVRPTSGNVHFKGNNLCRLRGRALRETRAGLQLVFQDPYASLNPRLTIGQAIAEPLVNLRGLSWRDAERRATGLLERVGLDPSQRNRYPHEFSGGQRQRIGIARALAPEPDVLICDEPVSALDVSVQAQIINLLAELRRDLNLAMILIAHDLAVVRHLADEVAVMYLGRIVEQAAADTLYAHPKHPYTQALLSAVPIPDPAREATRERVPLQGDPPSPERLHPGCPFADRCPIADDDCRKVPPVLTDAPHRVACFKA